MNSLAGKVALITGGSRGLGREIATAFAGAGARVALLARNLEACELAAREIEACGGQVLALSGHAGHWHALDEILARVLAEFGRLDVLVNNAGKSPMYPSLADVSEPYMDSVLDLNFKGPFRLAVLAAEHMRDNGGGAIINVSSSAALRPNIDALPYAAAKAAVNALTVGLARAYAPLVRVNALVPGAFDTTLGESWNAEMRATLEAEAALGRIGQPREIAGAALFLASDASSYVTGSLLTVDGGLS